jgi:tripartite-type tricarboxylate transporter receptor subunit TctC
MGQCLSDRLGQPFIVENRPGAGSNIATQVLISAPADGYELLLVTLANAVNTTLYDKLNFDFSRDVAPVAGIFRVPLIMAVHPSVPAKTVSEFVAYAKANPGKVSFGSSGNGSAVHMAGELFKMMADVDMTHVPYRGEAAALTDLLGGRLQVVFGTMSSSIEYVRTGQLRALAVTSSTRSELLPHIATVSEFIPGFEAAAWAGMGAPRSTPSEIVTDLNKEANACLADPKIRQRLADFGGTALSLSPGEFAQHVSNETEKWGKVIKFAGIKVNE